MHQDADSESLNAEDKDIPVLSEEPSGPVVSRLELWSYYLCKKTPLVLNTLPDSQVFLNRLKMTKSIQRLATPLLGHLELKIIMGTVSDLLGMRIGWKMWEQQVTKQGGVLQTE
jgi:hypothetical protein